MHPRQLCLRPSPTSAPESDVASSPPPSSRPSALTRPHPKVLSPLPLQALPCHQRSEHASSSRKPSWTSQSKSQNLGCQCFKDHVPHLCLTGEVGGDQGQCRGSDGVGGAHSGPHAASQGKNSSQRPFPQGPGLAELSLSRSPSCSGDSAQQDTEQSEGPLSCPRGRAARSGSTLPYAHGEPGSQAALWASESSVVSSVVWVQKEVENRLRSALDLKNLGVRP